MRCEAIPVELANALPKSQRLLTKSAGLPACACIVDMQCLCLTTFLAPGN